MGIDKTNKSRIIKIEEIHKGVKINCRTSDSYDVTFNIPNIGSYFDEDVVKVLIGNMTARSNNGVGLESSISGIVKRLSVLAEDIDFLKEKAMEMAKTFRG